MPSFFHHKLANSDFCNLRDSFFRGPFLLSLGLSIRTITCMSDIPLVITISVWVMDYPKIWELVFQNNDFRRDDWIFLSSSSICFFFHSVECQMQSKRRLLVIPKIRSLSRAYLKWAFFFLLFPPCSRNDNDKLTIPSPGPWTTETRRARQPPHPPHFILILLEFVHSIRLLGLLSNFAEWENNQEYPTLL